ncbi:MAG: MFS transporter, partial [Burkholderiaceae bacterium]|nr:MFS transporter [Burkholderiaceae bacterium]
MRSLLGIRWTSPAAAVIAAALLLALTVGSRSSFGLFVGPLNTATMLGAATIGLALAIGQLAWGASQPLCGVLAQRFGVARVIAAGGALAALGIALVPLASDSASLIAALALGGAAGA